MFKADGVADRLSGAAESDQKVEGEEENGPAGAEPTGEEGSNKLEKVQ